MRLQRYILTGIITLIPIAVTWLVFDFILGLMIRLGSPAARFSPASSKPRNMPWPNGSRIRSASRCWQSS